MLEMTANGAGAAEEHLNTGANEEPVNGQSRS